ncbi:hypothetical protein I4U23_016498 [Adineta vaga]|nr:hypothetical protein I4U23_016498 [Adineta vaga]
MVLKSVVRYIINRYLKNYIEALDEKRVDFNLRNGHVSLENLHLKAESLSNFNLPILVSAGFIEKLTLTIPWMHLYTQPTRIFIQGLYLLVVPKNEIDRDLSEHYANKMKKVQRKVDELKTLMSEKKTLEEKDLTFFERMILQIMQNIEIIVENFHLSYETQSTSKLGHPFSFGFTFHRLVLIGQSGPKSTNQSKDKIPIIYTLKELSFLSMYWNRQCQSRIQMNFDTIINDLKWKVAKPYHYPQSNQMNYILHPENFQMNFQVRINPNEHSYQRSSYDAEILSQQLTMYIDSQQFSDLLDFIKFQNYSTLYERCQEYRDLYLKEFLGIELFTSEETKRIEILQRKLDVFNLANIRYSVETEINENHLEETSKHSSKNLSRWYWWKKRKSSSFNEHRQTSKITVETLVDDAIRYYIEDLPNIDIQIRIENVDLYLISPLEYVSSVLNNRMVKNREIITHVNIKETRLNIQKRSISSNTLFNCDLGNVYLYAIESERNEKRLLVKSLNNHNENSMVHLELEFYPNNSINVDYRFQWIFQPIQIIYDATMFNHIVECFDTNSNPNYIQYFKIKERHLSEMEKDLCRTKIFDMFIQFKEVSIEFPQYGYDHNSVKFES